MKKFLNERGVIHTLPLLIIIAVVGIISFLLISSTAPSGGLFGVLNPKPKSHAATSGCNLTNPAFCETFDEGPSATGERGRDLDVSKWSTSRMAGGDFPIHVNPVAQGPIPPCRSTFSSTSVFPPDDTLICDSATGKSAQMMTATTIQYYGSNSYMIRQPFDFAGRTGKIDFDVDAHSDPLGGFIEVVITDSPVPATTYREIYNNETGPTPINGLVLKFVNGCASAGAVPNNTEVFNNGVGTFINPTFTVYGSLSCSTTQQDMLNHFEIQLSQSHIEVYGSDFSTDNGQTFPNFHRLYGADINLPFTRGYLHFDARNHASTKYAHVPNVIFHWDNIGFDGPVVAADRAYEIPDNTHAMTAPTAEIQLPAENLGWTLLDGSPATGKPAGMYDPENLVNSLSFQNVDVTGATSAKLSLNTSFNPYTTFSTSEGIKYLLNGGANGAVWHTRNLTDAEVAALNITGSQGIIAWTIDVNKDELVNGTNTIQFLPVNAPMDIPPVIANIDLLVSTGASASSTPTASPSVTPTPSASQTPTSTPIPSGPTTPVVTVPTCINAGYTGSGVTISWAAVTPAVSVVDLGFDNNFNTGFNKYTSNGATSVTGPAGFSNGTLGPSLNPNTTYYTRTYNGTRSQVVSFSIPACSSVTPTPSSSPAESACQGADLDISGSVNIFDYNIMLSNFGKNGTGLLGDIDGNGTVNIFDYNILLGNFGKTGC